MNERVNAYSVVLMLMVSVTLGISVGDNINVKQVLHNQENQFVLDSLRFENENLKYKLYGMKDSIRGLQLIEIAGGIDKLNKCK